MVGLSGIIGRLQPRKVLVVGDLILDKYTIGNAKRISPEAPVAVVHVVKEEQRPGGAGNVILNFVSLGASVRALGRVGTDYVADELLQSLTNESVDISGIFKDSQAPTPLKNRVIASGQQIVRVDHEIVTPLSSSLEEKMIAALPKLLEDIEVVAVSDYGKGSVTPRLLEAIMSEARRRSIPVIADPKGTDFARYSGATILKPNKGEAYAAAGCSSSKPLEEAADVILRKADVDVLMVTRSEEGISVYHKDGKQEHYPVQAMEVKDVTGAGDTVLAVVAYAIANGLSYGEAAQFGNVAAAIAISHFGCARVTLAMLAKGLLEKDVVNKVFEEEHLYALKESLKGHKFAVLALSLEDGLRAEHFEAIQQLTEGQDRELVVFVKDNEPSASLIKVIAALQNVNYIIINGSNLDNLCRQIAPETLLDLDVALV